MKKYEIQIREQLTYRKQAIVEVPDTMTDSEFERVLDSLERSADSSNDMRFVADRYGVKVVINNPDDWSSPDYSEVEIEEYDELKE